MDKETINELLFKCLSCANNLEEVRSLLNKRADVNKIYEDFSTPLTKSIKHNMYSKVDLLLDYGADVNKKDGNNTSPILYCFYYCRNDSIFELLLKRGAIIDEICFRDICDSINFDRNKRFIIHLENYLLKYILSNLIGEYKNEFMYNFILKYMTDKRYNGLEFNVDFWTRWYYNVGVLNKYANI